ncbi:MAG: EthD family reductase [Sphingobium sp.]
MGPENGLRRREAGLSMLAAAAVAAMPDRAMTAPRSRPAFKVTEFVRRSPALDEGGFADHWEKERAPLLLELPGLDGLAFNRVLPSRSPGAPYDGVIEMWFASEAAYRDAFDKADARVLVALAEDWSRFAAGDAMAMTTNEVIILDRPTGRPAGRAKRVGLVGRHAGTSEADFFREWRLHAKDASDQPGLVDYIINFRSSVRPPSMPWDGFAEMWWKDWDAFEQDRVTIRPALGSRLAFFDAHQLLYVEESVARDPRSS